VWLIAMARAMASGRCFIAGSPQFHLLPRNVADFARIAVGSGAALAWLAIGTFRSRAKAEGGRSEL
jgi:hypothetical protein